MKVCYRECCGEEGESVLRGLYVELRMSLREVARTLGASPAHIRKRLRATGLWERRTLDFYQGRIIRRRVKSEGRRHRTNRIWFISLDELLETPTELLASRFGLSQWGVYYVRKKRVMEEAEKERRGGEKDAERERGEGESCD